MADAQNLFSHKKSSEVQDSEAIYFISSSQVINFVTKNLKLNKNWNVVDVGAGTGVLAQQLLALGLKKVTLVDSSSAVLNEAKKNLGTKVQYVKLNAEDLANKFNSEIDLLFVMNALHLFPKLGKALEAMSKSLKDSGFIVFNTLAPSFAFENSLGSTEKKMLQTNIEFYSGLAALTSNPIAMKTKELLESFYEGNYEKVYTREKFQKVFAKYNLVEKNYQEIVLTLKNKHQKAIWKMIAETFVDEPRLVDKLIDSLGFNEDAHIRQACFIYQKIEK